jgi:hypothetical protein
MVSRARNAAYGMRTDASRTTQRKPVAPPPSGPEKALSYQDGIRFFGVLGFFLIVSLLFRARWLARRHQF